MSTRKQLGTLLLVFLTGLGLVSITSAVTALLTRGEIIHLSQKTSPLQVSLARLQRAFERMSGNFARTAMASSTEDLLALEKDTERTLNEVGHAGDELLYESKMLDPRMMDRLRETDAQLRALAAERLEAQKRVADAYHRVTAAVESAISVTTRLSQAMIGLQNQSGEVLVKSRKISDESNSNIKSMLVLRERTEQIRSLIQETRLVDKKFRLNVLRDKFKAVLDGVAAQEVPDKELAAQIRSVSEKLAASFEGEGGLLASRASVLAAPQDSKARDVFDDKAKALNALIDGLGTKVLEAIDPLELAVHNANAGMNNATALIAGVSRVSTSAADLNARARTIQALAWQLVAASDAGTVDRIRGDVVQQSRLVDQDVSEIRGGLKELNRPQELSAVSAASDALSGVKQQLIGETGVAAIIRKGLDGHAQADRLFSSALRSIQSIAEAGSTRARDAENAQAQTVARIRGLSDATIVIVVAIGLLALIAGVIFSRRISQSILIAEELQHRGSQKLRVIVDTVREGVKALQGTSDQLAGTSETVTSNIERVGTNASALENSIVLIAGHANRASGIGSEAAGIIEQATTTLTRLQQTSSNINGVTEMIRKIAFQTNLLALNAAIEAARAGEAGMGFEIVAAEVKSLARAAADATEQIDVQVKATQVETKKVSEVFESLTRTMQEIRAMQASISDAVAAQTASTRQINEGIQVTASRFRGTKAQMGVLAMAQRLSVLAKELDTLSQHDME